MRAPWLKYQSARQDPEPDTRGLCAHCGEPVGWHDGLRNWLGQLTHHKCAGLWTGRRRVGTCALCRFAVFSDNAVQTGGGAWVHPVCANERGTTAPAGAK